MNKGIKAFRSWFDTRKSTLSTSQNRLASAVLVVFSFVIFSTLFVFATPQKTSEQSSQFLSAFSSQDITDVYISISGRELEVPTGGSIEYEAEGEHAKTWIRAISEKENGSKVDIEVESHQNTSSSTTIDSSLNLKLYSQNYVEQQPGEEASM